MMTDTQRARRGADAPYSGLPVARAGAPRARGQRARAMATALVAAIMIALTVLCPQVAWADDLEAAEDSALIEGVAFGLNGFERNAKGTAREMEGQPTGYRFPLQDASTLVVVRAPEAVLVYVDADAAAAAGFDIDSADDQEHLREMICTLDETHSMGGSLLSDVEDPWVFTTDAEMDAGLYHYRFVVEGENGRLYAVVTAADGASEDLDLGDGALWSVDAALVTADEVELVAAPTFWDRVEEFFTGIDYRPFWVSLKTSAAALVVTFVLGLLAAWRTMGTSSRLKGLLDSVFTIPMVLPPTVCGFLLLLVFGQSTPVGRWLIAHGISLVFTWPAAVISAIVVSFPLMYRTALGAFEGLDHAMLDAARTLGWSEFRIFRTLMLPLAWPSIAAGTVLAFARAMGEFGATLFFAGNYAGITQTIPIAIYFEWMGGNTSVALFWVIVVIAFSFLVILFINLYTAHSQTYRMRGTTRAERRQRASDAADGTQTALASADTVRLDQEALRALLGDEAGAGDDEGRG